MNQNAMTYFTEDGKEVSVFPVGIDLINSKSGATLIEEKILRAAYKSVQEDENLLYADLYAGELKKEFGNSSGSFYTQLKECSTRLGTRYFLFENKEKKQFEINFIVNKVIYDNGKYRIIFNNDCKKMLINLKKNFALLDAKVLFSLKSKASICLYEKLEAKCFVPKYEKEKHNVKDHKFQFSIGLNELKIDFGAIDINNSQISQLLIGKSSEMDWDDVMEKVIKLAEKETNPIIKKQLSPKWQEWRDFNKVLSNTVKEINELSNMDVEYTPIKRGAGGKVEGIDFTVTYKTFEELQKMVDEKGEPDNVDIKPSQEDILEYIDEIRNVTGTEFTSKEINIFLKEARYNIDLIKKQYKNFISSRKRNLISDKTGWMISAIRNDYNENDEEVTKESLSEGIDEMINLMSSDK